MKNHLRNAFLTMLCFALIVSTPLAHAAVGSTNSSLSTPHGVAESPVDSIIEDYLSLRESSVISVTEGGMTIAARSSAMSRLSGLADQSVLKKEDGRRRGHAVAAKNAGIVVFDSRAEILTKTVEAGKDTIKVRLYEETTCDYRGVGTAGTHPYDTFRFGLWHEWSSPGLMDNGF